MDLRTDDVSRPVETHESAPTPPRPKKSMFDWASYNPSGSVSRFEQSLELGTSIGQRFFGSWYLRVMSASVMLTDVMPRAMKSKQQAQEVMDVVTTFYDKAHEELQDELLTLRKMLREKGVVAQKRFTKPRTLNVPFYNNYCLRYLQLVAMFEDIVWHLDCLATYGVITNAERISRQAKARSKMSRVSMETTRVWTRAKASIRRVSAEDGADQAAGIEQVEKKVADLTQTSATEAGIEINGEGDDESAQERAPEAVAG